MNPAVDAAEVQRCKRAYIKHLECIAVGGIADDREDAGEHVAGKNADDEGDKLCHLLAEGGAYNNHKKGYESAEDMDEAIGAGSDVGKIADGASCKGEADDGNRWPNDDRWHELIDPAGTERFDRDGDHNINQAREDCAHDDSEITKGGCGIHCGEECEGTSKEDRALCFGESDVNAGSHACAKQRGGNVHFKVLNAVCIHQHRHNQRSRHDGEHLLQRKYDELDEFGFVFDPIDEVHVTISFFPA